MASLIAISPNLRKHMLVFVATRVHHEDLSFSSMTFSRSSESEGSVRSVLGCEHSLSRSIDPIIYQDMFHKGTTQHARPGWAMPYQGKGCWPSRELQCRTPKMWAKNSACLSGRYQLQHSNRYGITGDTGRRWQQLVQAKHPHDTRACVMFLRCPERHLQGHRD